MTDDHDDAYADEEDLEPPWPGWRKLTSGRAGVVAVVTLIAVGFWAYRMVEAQQAFNSPSHTQVVCVPISFTPSDSGSGGAPVTPPPVCITGHS
jgi:hypothetical protein